MSTDDLVSNAAGGELNMYEASLSNIHSERSWLSRLTVGITSAGLAGSAGSTGAV